MASQGKIQAEMYFGHCMFCILRSSCIKRIVDLWRFSYFYSTIAPFLYSVYDIGNMKCRSVEPKKTGLCNIEVTQPIV